MRSHRKSLPDGFEAASAAFSTVLSQVEPAKLVLTEAVPTTRLPGRPLPDAVSEFEALIRRALEAMPGWHRPETEREWLGCEAGLEESLDRARRLREEAPDLGGFEGLIWAVDQLIAPLQPFEAAAERFRSLRKGRG